MFETLTQRLNQVFVQLRRRGKLSEADADAALREVRLALLEADVHFGAVKTFIGNVRDRAIGTEVSKALNPGQQVVKIVNEELITTLGDAEPLKLSGPKPRCIMLVGLQVQEKPRRLASWRGCCARKANGSCWLLATRTGRRPCSNCRNWDGASRCGRI